MSDAAAYPSTFTQTETVTPTRQRVMPQFLGWILRMLVAALFIYAATIKIDDPTRFAKDIRNYEVFTETLTNVMAYTIPWIEFVAAALLVIGVWRLEARLLIGGMLVAFTTLKIYIYVLGQDLDCGCFGETLLAQLSHGLNGVYLNIGMLLALLLDWVLTRAPRKPKSRSHPAV